MITAFLQTGTAVTPKQPMAKVPHWIYIERYTPDILKMMARSLVSP